MNSKLKILFFCIWSISCFPMQETEQVDPLILSNDRAGFSDFLWSIESEEEEKAIEILNYILRKNCTHNGVRDLSSGIYLGYSPNVINNIVEKKLFNLTRILCENFTDNELKDLLLSIVEYIKTEEECFRHGLLERNPHTFQNWKDIIKKILTERVLLKSFIDKFKTIILPIFNLVVKYKNLDIIYHFADRHVLNVLLEVNKDFINELVINKKFAVLKILKEHNPDLYELRNSYNDTTLTSLAKSCLGANLNQIKAIKKSFDFLISQKVDLGARDCFGKNVLDILVDIQGNSDSLRVLIDIFLRLGINTSSVLGLRNRQEPEIGKTAFTRVFENENLEEIKKFIETKSNEIVPIDWNCLLKYPISENIHIIRYWFIQNKICLDYKPDGIHNLLEIAVKNNDWNFADLLISHKPLLFENFDFDSFLNQFLSADTKILDFGPILLLCERAFTNIRTNNVSKLFSKCISIPNKRPIEALGSLGVNFLFKGDFGLNALDKDLHFMIHNASFMSNPNIMKNVYYAVRNGFVIQNQYLAQNKYYIELYNRFKKYAELADQFRDYLNTNGRELLNENLNLESVLTSSYCITQEQATATVNLYKNVLANFVKCFFELGEHVIVPCCFMKCCLGKEDFEREDKMPLVALIENSIENDLVKEILFSILLYINENN